jgi:hypothetical protein
MCTRTPLGRQLGDERFGPATSQMLKRVAADPIEFREIYFSMNPRFRDREDEERIEQVRKTFFLRGDRRVGKARRFPTWRRACT